MPRASHASHLTYPETDEGGWLSLDLAASVEVRPQTMAKYRLTIG